MKYDENHSYETEPVPQFRCERCQASMWNRNNNLCESCEELAREADGESAVSEWLLGCKSKHGILVANWFRDVYGILPPEFRHAKTRIDRAVCFESHTHSVMFQFYPKAILSITIKDNDSRYEFAIRRSTLPPVAAIKPFLS